MLFARTTILMRRHIGTSLLPAIVFKALLSGLLIAGLLFSLAVIHSPMFPTLDPKRTLRSGMPLR